MGLFKKEACDICGKEIRLGKRKLEDGMICKDCAKQLSPFFSERRQSTLDEIKDQLAYREANKESVAAFRVTRTLGGNTKVLLDEDARKFIVTSSNRWEEENPDVIDFSQATGCNVDTQENRREIKYTNSEGRQESYNPPRYEYTYDVYMTIFVNSPYFDEIKFQMNSGSISSKVSPEFDSVMNTANEIRDVLTDVHQELRAASAPKQAMTCPHCNATTIPDASGRCEFCGGALAS